MNDFKVKWLGLATYELNEIVKYIVAQGAPAAAVKLRKKIRKAAADLSFSPYRVYFNKKLGYRKCNVGEYKIIFKIIEAANPKRVEIIRVVHGRRNLRRLVR